MGREAEREPDGAIVEAQGDVVDVAGSASRSVCCVRVPVPEIGPVATTCAGSSTCCESAARADLAPLPGLRELDALAEQLRSVGLRVELRAEDPTGSCRRR